MARSLVGAVVGRGAFIEGHDDIGAQLFLDVDGFFGGKAVGRAVDVALKGHAVLIDLAHLGQRKDLKPARIGQHGVRPLHEPVQPAHLGHQVGAGAQVEVVGVGQAPAWRRSLPAGRG